MEGEGLAVEPGSHEREHQGRRPHQGNDPDAVPVTERDQGRARIRHGRQAGFRDESDIPSAVEQGGERLDFLGRGVLVEQMELQRVDMAFQPGPGQIPPRGPDLFDDEDVQRPQTLQDRSGNHLGGVIVPERRGDQVQAAFLIHLSG